MMINVNVCKIAVTQTVSLIVSGNYLNEYAFSLTSVVYKKTGHWALDRVQTHASHSIAFN